MINYAEILSQLLDEDGFVRLDRLRDPLPTGFVLNFAGDILPDGYLPAHGGAYSRITYSSLFARIGTRYGAGDGRTTFNVPDGRGLVIRGWDAGRGIDTYRVLGTYQEDAIRNIWGNFNSYAWRQNGSGAFYPISESGGSQPAGTGRYVVTGFDASRVVPTANENRMKNIAFMTCIKY